LSTVALRVWVFAVLVGIMAALAACATPRLYGELSLDGRPFVARGCRAGYHERFYGVDLFDAGGRALRVRYTQDPPGLFPYPRPGQSRPAVAAVGVAGGGWDVVAPCGPLLIERGGKGAFDGETRLDCRSDRHVIVGRIRFEDCN
jgi:hypothetical protein